VLPHPICKDLENKFRYEVDFEFAYRSVVCHVSRIFSFGYEHDVGTVDWCKVTTYIVKFIEDLEQV
jgi:hypothetical protein